MSDDLLTTAGELQRRGEPFALATVVRCERPTSAKPGAKALIREDGSVAGWVGGACAEPTVVREAMNALRDGRPRLVALVGEGGRGPSRTEGIVEHPMTCHSGGTLEIYVEPYLPKPMLVLIGHGPVVDALATLGRAADYAVVTVSGRSAELEQLRLTPRASVVVATHADSDEDVLAHVLTADVGYVSLVASRLRAAAILARLVARGVPPSRLGRLKAPAGIDIGATEPAEIAVSILAEIILHHRSGKPEVSSADTMEATDPVCGMTVDVAGARYRSDVGGQTVYFCCSACKETFVRR